MSAQRYLESEAFVLRVFPLGEADRIVSLFSRSEGKVRGVAPHAASSRRRFGGSLSVMAEIDVRFKHMRGRDLGRLEWGKLLAPTPGEGRDLQAFYACTYMAEMLEQFGREGEADEALYRLARAVTRELGAGGDAVLLMRYFEIWVLRLAGLLPDLAECAGCMRDLGVSGASVAPEAEPLCPGCSSGPVTGLRRLSAPAVRLVRGMQRVAPGSPELDRAGSGVVEEAARLAEALFLHATEKPFRAAEPTRPWGRVVVGAGGQS